MPPKVFEAFADVDLILHAGDLVSEEVLVELGALAPVKAVVGNCDPLYLAHDLSFQLKLELAGYRIGLTHGHLGTGNTVPERALSLFEDVDLVVFGHSHSPYNETVNGIHLFNPGSATDRRWEPKCSVGIIELGRGIECRHIFF